MVLFFRYNEFMKKLITLIFLFFSLNSSAGLYLEPYLLKAVSGFDQAKEKKNPNNLQDEYDAEDGTTFGARLGWTFKKMFVAGVDVSSTTVNWKLGSPESVKTTLSAAGNSHTDEMKANHYGLFAANKVKYGLVHVAAYWTIYEDQNDNSLIDKGDQLQGYTYAIGTGFVVAKFIRLGIEWRSSKLFRFIDKSNNSRAYALPHENVNMGEYRTQEFYLMVSVPLAFGKS